MPIYKVSQAEYWHRVYAIEADSLDEAKELYKDYLLGKFFDIDDHFDPEYLEDLDDDVEWYEDNSPVSNRV